MLVLEDEQRKKSNLRDQQHQGKILAQAGRVVEEVLQLLRKLESDEVKILEPSERPLGLVWVDPIQIFQVIGLLGLGIRDEHSLNGKTRTLELGVEHIDIPHNFTAIQTKLSPGPYVAITIKDSWNSVSSQIMDPTFNPFSTPNNPGEGLGLVDAVVRDILTRQDETVKVENTSGEVSVIHIYWPCGVAQSEFAVPQGHPLPKGHECILFVGENAAVWGPETKLLRHLGYEVITYTNSVEALKAFRRTPHDFDLVITDFQMPEMSGSSLAYKLQEVRSHIPVILHIEGSGLFSQALLEALGFCACLRKPISARDIASTVRRVLDEASEGEPEPLF